ncbi:MAG: hypothetical protein ACYS91_06970 [Planctomycetota bacterium]|jgi:hypothetical protein
MNVNEVLTMDYEQLDTWSSGKNEPNSNPIQTQSKPIKAQKMPKQTQYKAKQSQFQRKKCCFPPFCCGISKEKIIFCNRLTKKYQID